MSVSEAKKRSDAKYFKEHWSQVKLSMPNEEAEKLRSYCSEHGLTVAGFIRNLVKQAIESDTPGGCDKDQAAGVSSQSTRND